MRVVAATWPFTFGVSLGWATTTIPNPAIKDARGRVYLLRGQGMIFSTGFGLICDRLRNEGLWAQDLCCTGDRWMLKHLSADHGTGILRGPIMMIGHSCGGRYALHAAKQLSYRGISVELIICIDVAMPYEVSDNIRHAVHLYRSRQRIYPARPLRPEPGARTQVDNIDLDEKGSVIPPAGLNHLNMTRSKILQDWVVERVLSAV